MRDVLRSMALVVAFACVTFGCSGKQQSAAVAAAEAGNSSHVADFDAQRAQCAEGDIECEERMYQLEETLFAYEAGIAQVLVRGARLVAPTGIANFDPAQCRWVYQTT